MKDYSRNKGDEKLIVSRASPLLDVLEYQNDAHKDVLSLLDTLMGYRLYVEEALEAAVQRARNEGKSWSQLGAVLGVTKQAAWQRFGKDAQSEDPPERGAADAAGDGQLW